MDELARLPAFKVVAWDRKHPQTPFATARQYTGEVNQDSIVTIVASDDTRRALLVSAPDQATVSTLGEILAIR